VTNSVVVAGRALSITCTIRNIAGTGATLGTLANGQSLTMNFVRTVQ